LYIGELDLRMTFFNDKSYIDNLIYCIKHNAHFDQFHNDFIRPEIRKCNILIEKDKEHGIYAFGDDLYVLEKSSDNAYNNCKKCALLQECQRKYVNYADGESTVIVQIKELYTEEVCHNGYRNFFKQLTKINNMEYNEKFKKVEGFDNIYFYEGNLYKREFIHTSVTSYLSCNSCYFVSTCHGNGLRMPVPEPCIKDSYFKKITTLPTQCDTCKNYEPKSTDNLPTNIEDVKKIIGSKDVDEEKLTLMTNLIKAREIYRQGWKPDWEDSSTTKYIIVGYHHGCETAHLIVLENKLAFEYIFSFQTKEIAQKFLDNFKKELNQFYEIN
jgi:hypothetical protein